MKKSESDRKEFLWGRVPYFAITASNITSGEFRLYGEYFQYSEQIKAFIGKVRKSGLDCLASDGR